MFQHKVLGNLRPSPSSSLLHVGHRKVGDLQPSVYTGFNAFYLLTEKMSTETDVTSKAICGTGLDGWIGLEISEQGSVKSTFVVVGWDGQAAPKFGA